MRARIWPLYLVLPFAYGRVITAVAIFTIAFLIFNSAHTLENGFNTPALFFSAILAYIVPVFSLITQKCQQALTELRPELDLDEETFESLHSDIGATTVRHTLLTFLCGLGAGIAHLLLLTQSSGDLITYVQQNPVVIVGWVGTLLVWLVMTAVTASLVDTAVIFARLGAGSVRINLLNTQPLVAFARVAIISSLAIIGAQALFPLMYLDQTVSMATALPGLLVMVIPLLALFAVPVWPVHRRLSEAKTRGLQQLNQRIAVCRGDASLGHEAESDLLQLNQLLQLRREVIQAPVWPFDAGSITRLLLYMVIIPLTWAGAALIEMLVEAFI